MPTYRQSDLINAIWDTKIEQNAASQIDQQGVVNFAVREVIRKMDLRSTKRIGAIIDLFTDIYDTTCPPDLKGQKIIDLIPQVRRSPNFEVELVPAEEFDRRKTFEKHLVAFNDHDMLRKLRVAVLVNSQKITISPLDNLTSGGGTWTAVGDATNLRADTQNFLEGNGSILWDIGAGATGSAGIKNTALNTFDISNYLLQGSVFLWTYIQSASGITNFTLQLGSDSSDYYQVQVTATNEGNAFSVGWNLLRFDLANATKSGTPVSTSCTYASLVMNSSPAITNSVNWRFDGLMIMNGALNNVAYYSKYGWQDSATGAWKENSTTSTDFLNVDTEEFNLIALRGKIESDRRLRDWNAHAVDTAAFTDAAAEYLDQYPSEAKLLTQTYYDTSASLGVNNDLDTIVQTEEEGFEQPLT